MCARSVGETTEIKVWESRRDRASGKGIKGGKANGRGEREGGNEEEQRWSGGKGEPSKHFPVHFSSGGLN